MREREREKIEVPRKVNMLHYHFVMRTGLGSKMGLCCERLGNEDQTHGTDLRRLKKIVKIRISLKCSSTSNRALLFFKLKNCIEW